MITKFMLPEEPRKKPDEATAAKVLRTRAKPGAKVDYAALIRDTIKRFPKTLARLAK
jgi:hypothetical protein